MKPNRAFITAQAIGFLIVASASGADVPALKEVFKGEFLIGAALSPRQFSGQDKLSADLVAKHFNTITPENVLKWGVVHPREDGYDFSLADQYVRFGEAHGMKIIGHTLVWHNQTPAWVFKKNGEPADRDTLLRRMRDHIQTVMGRYKGRIKGWDVVNEALDETGKMRESQWFKIIGPDYVSKAFQFAHEADPAAELYYNDFSLENAPKREGAVRLIKELQAQGVPVHAVGLQGHYKMDWPKPQQLQETIDAFSALNLKCMITELDLDVLSSARRGGSAEVGAREEPSEKVNPFREGLPLKIQREQAARYAELFEVLVKNSKAVERVTFWGVTDADSWLNNWPVRGRTNYPLLFDRNGKPKPAFAAVIATASKK